MAPSRSDARIAISNSLPEPSLRELDCDNADLFRSSTGRHQLEIEVEIEIMGMRT